MDSAVGVVLDGGGFNIADVGGTDENGGIFGKIFDDLLKFFDSH